jgi:Protein of unknown function (DUF3558)
MMVRRAVVALLLLLSLTGCSTGGPAATTTVPGATAAGAAMDACSLLTDAEVSAATGLQLTGRGEPALPDGRECNWQLEPGTNAAGVTFKRFVDVTIFGKPAFDAAAAASDAEQVPGIGDQAVVTNGALGVLKGTRSFTLVVTLDEPGLSTPETVAQERAAELALGKLAAGRL